jgi:hypothetical protein
MMHLTIKIEQVETDEGAKLNVRMESVDEEGATEMEVMFAMLMRGMVKHAIVQLSEDAAREQEAEAAAQGKPN